MMKKEDLKSVLVLTTIALICSLLISLASEYI